MQHSRTGEAMLFSKKNDSIGNLDSNSDFITVSLALVPGMTDEVHETFLKHFKKGNLYVTPGFGRYCYNKRRKLQT